MKLIKILFFDFFNRSIDLFSLEKKKNIIFLLYAEVRPLSFLLLSIGVKRVSSPLTKQR